MHNTTRTIHNDCQGYDSETDSWFVFDSPEQAHAWAAEPEQAVKYAMSPAPEIHVVSVAPAFNSYNIGVTCPAATAVGPIVQLAQADEGRMRLMVNAIVPAGSFLIVGTREGVAAGQGYPLTNGLDVELRNTRAVWAALALGTATGPLTGTVGVLTESLVG